jgi:hypothetical protein
MKWTQLVWRLHKPQGGIPFHHLPHAISDLLGCGNGCTPEKKENAMTQKEQNDNHGELSGKRIVVLGGSSGIGLAVAQQVVARGRASNHCVK